MKRSGHTCQHAGEHKKSQLLTSGNNTLDDETRSLTVKRVHTRNTCPMLNNAGTLCAMLKTRTAVYDDSTKM